MQRSHQQDSSSKASTHNNINTYKNDNHRGPGKETRLLFEQKPGNNCNHNGASTNNN